jgi:hypothetical protein
MSKTKVFDVFNRIAKIVLNKGTLVYGNEFQGELLLAVMDSGTARLCVERRADYICGKHFENEEINNAKIGNITFSQLLVKSSENVALFRAITYKILIDNKGLIYKIEPLPTDKVIKRDDKKFVYNYTLNTRNYEKNKEVIYDGFDTSWTTQERLNNLKLQLKDNRGKQKGFILYKHNAGIGEEIYPVPAAYSGIEDIRTDAELSKFELENLENGFLPSAVLTMIGELDDTIINEETGKTEADVMKEKLQKFTGKTGGRSKLLVLTAETKEQLPQLSQLDVGQLLSSLDQITERVGKKVCKLFSVPPILAGFSEPSILGSNQTFKNALIILQHSVLKDQNLIKETLESIFPEMNMDFSIKPLQLIEYIPSELLSKMTDSEKRKLAGFKQNPFDETEENQKIIDKLSILPPAISSKVLELMSEEQIMNLAGIKFEPKIQTDEKGI